MAFFTRMGHSVPEFPLGELSICSEMLENPGPSHMVVPSMPVTNRHPMLHRQPPPPYGIPPINYSSSLYIDSIDEEEDGACCSAATCGDEIHLGIDVWSTKVVLKSAILRSLAGGVGNLKYLLWDTATNTHTHVIHNASLILWFNGEEKKSARMMQGDLPSRGTRNGHTDRDGSIRRTDYEVCVIHFVHM